MPSLQPTPITGFSAQIFTTLAGSHACPVSHSHHPEGAEASGIIAYARALALTAVQQGILSEDAYKQEALNRKIMDQSFRAQVRNDEEIRSLKSTASANASQWAALILAYSSLSMLLIINLYPPQINTERNSVWIVDWLVTQDGTFLAALFSLGGIVVISTVVRLLIR